ncbi:MAG: hypothetical protein FWE63_04095 [Bacteroidales bacterium]|nr:hypothetical protein [Bacteroidales bacterium]
MNVLFDCKVENQEIWLRFTNISSDTIALFSPCKTNTFIYISNIDGIELMPQRMFRRAFNAKIFYLGNSDYKDFLAPYNLGELFELENDQIYKIRVEYYIYEKGKSSKKFKAFVNLYGKNRNTCRWR